MGGGSARLVLSAVVVIERKTNDEAKDETQDETQDETKDET